MAKRQSGGEVKEMISEAVDLPLWKEHRVVLELIRLRLSRVFAGTGVPRGNGEPVLLIPGFLCGDLHMAAMNGWLKRIGYTPFESGISVNIRCIDAQCQALIGRIKEIQAEAGQPVHLVGHSLGGMLARSSAALCPGSVASVTALGSPFRQLRSHGLVLSATKALSTVYQVLPSCSTGCMTPACGCAAVQEADNFPKAIPFTAVYTRSDGVVDWESCRTGQKERDVEVTGTHLGLMYNPDAYRAIAKHLARACAASTGVGAPARKAA